MGRKKKTHNEFVKEVKDKYGNEYIVLGEYINNRTKIKVKHNCKECNYHEWGIRPHHLLQGYGCPICGKEKVRKTHGVRSRRNPVDFVEKIKEKYQEEYEILGEYINSQTKILVRHNCDKCKNYEWLVRPYSLLQGHGCPVCGKEKGNQKAVLGINTIWDTDRWMCDLGVSEEDAKRYTRCSGQKITIKCPDCGREKKIKISRIYNNKSIGCLCGDGKSYPEKFVFNLLEQLDVDFETEYSPKWIKPKRYDFYIKECYSIIETHGEQHYNGGFNSVGGLTLEQEQQNDKYKKETALKNGIKHYVELDCRESNLEYIKNSILNSELSKLFNLSNIDWNKCAEFANKNIVKEVCECWNNRGDTERVKDIAKKFKLSQISIISYLKRGSKLRWCKYDSKERLRKHSTRLGKSRRRKVEIFKGNKSLGIFSSCTELSRQSEKLFEVKLLNNMISMVCNGKRKQYKGFAFKYVEENNNNLNVLEVA